MKITVLEAENVKRIKAVSITPDGHVVAIGGANAAGKSSVLDGIAYALGGKSLIPDEPLRRGQKKGHVTIKLDGDNPLTVKRTFTSKGTSSLTVTTADGLAPKSPQALLDSLCGRIAFDPLEFTRLSPAKQAETLRGLVGLDFTEHDAKHLAIFEKRTIVNRDVKSTEAKLDSAPQHGGVPDEEVSVADLTKELESAQTTNTAKTQAGHQANDAVAGEVLAGGRVIHTEAVLATAQKDFDAAVEYRGKCREEAARLKAEADKLPTVECQPILDRIAASDKINTAVRENIEKHRLAAELAGLSEQADSLTEQLEQLDEDKQQAMESADWPIEGLGFGDDGVTFADLPFEQASSAEQLRISVAVGLAVNPKLRVLLIRDGSLLDEDNFATIAAMAEEADAQVWIERVGEGAECSVIISDGMVKEEEPDKQCEGST